MKITVFGSKGFIGSAVEKELTVAGHKVYNGNDPDVGGAIDLLDDTSVCAYLSEVKPDAVINCAGIISGELADFEKNVQFTHNILDGIHRAGLRIKRVVICGSAGEYGEVKDLPVKESTPLGGSSPYAQSKIREEQEALKLMAKYDIPLVVTRIFNPIGPNMKEKFLIPSLIRQIGAIQSGVITELEVSRLDARRDYVDVRDIARALRLIVEGTPKHLIYNIGSGLATTNGELLELLLKNSKLESRPKVVETSNQPEPQLAVQADISLLRDDFGWQPSKTIDDVIKETLNATEQ